MLNLDKSVPGSTKAYRLLWRIRELASETLRCYAYRLALIEIEQERRIDRPNEDLWNTVQDTKNAFLKTVSDNIWILFVDDSKENDTCNLRLVDTNDSLTREVTSFLRTILNSSGDENGKTLLNKGLLKISDVNKVDLKKAKNTLNTYRNKFSSHLEDYSPQTSEEQIFYPELLNLAKLTYGLLRIIQETNRRSNIPYIGPLGTFEETIDTFKASFKRGLAGISQ